MASRGFGWNLTARSRRGLTLAWVALFALSVILQYSVMSGTARAAEVSPNAAAAVNLDAAVCGTVPLDIELIIDTSGSMALNSSGTPSHTRLYWAQHAADQLVTDLQNNGGIGGASGHRLGVTTFNGTTSTSLGGWSSTAAELTTLIDGIDAFGNTPLKTGMAQGASDLTANARSNTGSPAADGAVKRVIIILSDGRPNPDQGPNGVVATTTSGERPTQSQLDSFAASADEVWSIAIGQGGSGTSQVDTGLMQLLAEPLAGHYHNVIDASNLGSMFTSVFHSIACPADLTAAKAVDKATANPGDTLNYTITLSNSGGTDATDVAVSDPISALLAHGTFGACDNGCTNDASSVDWSGLTVPAGGSLALHFSIVLDTSGWAVGTTDLGNTVVVDGTNCAAQSDDASCSTDTTVTVSHEPAIHVVKSASVDSLPFPGGEVTYTYVVTNTGNVPLSNVNVADDTCASPAYVSGDDGNDLLDLSEAWTYTCTMSIDATTTNIVTATGHDGDTTVSDQDTKTVSVGSEIVYGLGITKSYTGNTGGTAFNGDGIAKVGDTLAYTLAYQVSGATVFDGVITDVLPNGLTYVDGSATDSAEFTFAGYDAGSRTLTWVALSVSASGSVTYQATVQDGSFDLPQPLENVATISSEQTDPVSDTADVLVQAVEAATATPTVTAGPTVTLPPTDTISGDQAPSNPGFGLMLTLLALAGIGLVAGYFTSTSSRLRRERADRR